MKARTIVYQRVNRKLKEYLRDDRFLTYTHEQVDFWRNKPIRAIRCMQVHEMKYKWTNKLNTKSMILDLLLMISKKDFMHRAKQKTYGDYMEQLSELNKALDKENNAKTELIENIKEKGMMPTTLEVMEKDMSDLFVTFKDEFRKRMVDPEIGLDKDTREMAKMMLAFSQDRKDTVKFLADYGLKLKHLELREKSLMVNAPDWVSKEIITTDRGDVVDDSEVLG